MNDSLFEFINTEKSKVGTINYSALIINNLDSEF